MAGEKQCNARLCLAQVHDGSSDSPVLVIHQVWRKRSELAISLAVGNPMDASGDQQVSRRWSFPTTKSRIPVTERSGPASLIYSDHGSKEMENGSLEIHKPKSIQLPGPPGFRAPRWQQETERRQKPFAGSTFQLPPIQGCCGSAGYH